MSENTRKNLQTALESVFSEEEATALARLLDSFQPHDTIYYENIDLPEDQKAEYILMAFEERLLIPYTSSPGGAWQDSMLTLAPGSLYIMPRVIKTLVDDAAKTGRFDPDAAIRDVLAEKEDKDEVKQLIDYFNRLKPHAVSYKIEAGLLGTLNQGPTPLPDLHNTVDLFVLVGMMSPCTRGPITSGLAWYELNPALYWG